jgi:sulfonate transport system ATP-binding protein
MTMQTDTSASIEAREVIKRFGPREVLRGVDLDVAPGRFVAIVGKSGCGKSTLLRLLAGLDAPTAGSIRIGDEAPRIGAPMARMMFQEARLLPWKRTLANVALGLPRDRRPDAAGALAEVGLADRAGDWPAALSGGQRQRIALARALVSRPRLLLLDEPLGALDALTRIEMQRLIERVWQDHGFTAVLVTHDVAEAVALADRIVVLGEGRVILDWPVDLPRPRARGNHAFAAIEEEVLDQILTQRPDAPPVVSLPARRPLERTA